jgi:serine/threonine-protein kinase
MKSAPEDGTGGTARQPELARLGEYRLLSVIGAGSMGTVYRSIDPGTNRALAIKAVRLEAAGQPDSESLCTRLRLEAEATSALSHPGIVTVHEYGEEAGHAFSVMDYVEGNSLRDCFERGMAFSLPRSVEILVQVLEALQYAHDRGVWHRDIKPSNILVGVDGRVKLTDFGIARLPGPTPGPPEAILGTPGYIAPESYLSDTFDSRVDLFAASAVLYHLLAGVPAFAGTADQVMFKVCHETPLRPSMVAGKPSLQPYDVLVLKGLARRPEDRFASAAEFRQALRALERTRE